VPAPGRLSRLPWKLRYQLGGELASGARRLAILATHQHCTVRIPRDCRLGPGFQLDIPNEGTLVIGQGTEFRNGFVCQISGSGRVTIGPGSVFTSAALIQCSTAIEIGARCVFGQSCFIGDGNHRFRDHTRHVLDQGYDFRPVHIGDGAVVLTKCTVVNDIGRGAVIGANSVVVRPVPDYCLAVGSPAKVIEYFGPPELRPEGLQAP
jgi:acetyltransferase-like isoleucine patch superfamily enzyme